ncbi:hypothetical protein AKJ48_01135 [candidate division MSBL1 archaeon SCGC-AAA261O19]|uniref:4Fe-4S Mo/W bis-MGD-type domain-containing protein n=1 Tax=candidate division MSBL1 archaeon SCGC-AAA261O19 TaxID=1698277 RepID=A0A133VEM1_9EURY|nr:hypothetical protein AKJ48_01135 [candidate division MSBL1 archaeon SCGC-AAA261O19]
MTKMEIPTYCYQCPNGPDPIKVIVHDGVPTKIEPNFDAESIHPAGGKICVKAYGLIDKIYNPDRVKTPLLRQNPKKGEDEDPQWKEISWDEAFDILGEKLKKLRGEGLIDENGYPKVAITLGGGGTPEGHYGTLPCFLASIGAPVDLTIGTGQGVSCYHSEHVYNEFWHRAFIVVPDLPQTRYLLAFGSNTNASEGVGIYNHAEAREKGMERIQVEPHLSVTGANSDRWIPIKPRTDSIFLYTMIHTILHEMEWREVCDVKFLKEMTNSPYLIGPNGYYLRDSETKEPLIWDSEEEKAKPHDDLSIKDYSLEGEYTVKGVEFGPDDKVWEHEKAKCHPAFQLLINHVADHAPEKAEEICDVPAETIRGITSEFIENANVGATVEVEGEKLPYRPVAITLGKSVNNGWGGYQATWARTVLLTLVGALEVPGGGIGADTRLNLPYHDKWRSVQPGSDGFMHQFLNPTDKDSWPPDTMYRGPYTALTPLIGNQGWASGVAPFTLAWKFMSDPPKNWPAPSPPKVWMVYRANPVRTQWDRDLVEDVVGEFPFMVHFTYVLDETSWYSDLILPDHTDLEGTQLRMVAPHHWTAPWDYYGFLLKQPVIKPIHDTRETTDIFTEIADRAGFLDDYNHRVNRGTGIGISLKGDDYDYRLEKDEKYQADEIWDRICKAATRTLSGGEEEEDLTKLKEKGFFVTRFPKLRHYLHPIMKKWGLRYELPYGEKIKKVGKELEKRLHEREIDWWDRQLEEYQALPNVEDFSGRWNKFYAGIGENPDEFDFWLIATRSMQFAFTANTSLHLMYEAAEDVLDFGGVVMNHKIAKEKGIEHGDTVMVESPFKKKKATALLREGIRPDTAVIQGQFDQDIAPVAEDISVPNVKDFTKLDTELLDEGGSGVDLSKVKIYKVEE